MKHTLARTCIAALVTLLLALVCAGALAESAMPPWD